MAAVSRAFFETSPRRGSVIGIVPGGFEGGRVPPWGYPNPWVEIPIRTHLPLSGKRGTAPMSRNHINVLSSDFVIAMPGGYGTRSEVELALHYGTPVIAHLEDRQQIPELPDSVPMVEDLTKLISLMRRSLGRRA